MRAFTQHSKPICRTEVRRYENHECELGYENHECELGIVTALRRECVVVRQYGCIYAVGEKLVLRFTSYRHLLSLFDDCFDFLYCQAPEAANKDVAQTQTLRAHG